MELRQLEHLVAVADECSFTRAAGRLHLVQSALSVSVRNLDRELGVRLLARSTHSVALTAAGAAFLPEARRTLAAAGAARDVVDAVRGGVRGTVRVGIMHSLTLIDLAGILTEFHRSRPGVEIVPRPAQGGSAELTADLAAGRLDVAFAALPSDRYPAGVEVTPLAAEEMVLVCPQGRPGGRRPVPLAELDGVAFVDAPRGWGTREEADRLFAEHRLSRITAVEVGDIPTTVDLVRAGFGVALMSPSTISDRRGVVLRRVTPSASFTVSLLSGKSAPRSAALQAFVDLVLDSTGAGAAGSGPRAATGR